MSADQNQVSSVVPLRWCISPETAKLLQEKNIQEAHLLIVVSHGSSESARYVVPLKAQMQYVQFRHPGANIIHATVIWPGWADKPLRREVLKKDNRGHYENRLLEKIRPGEQQLEDQLEELERQYNATADEGVETRLEQESRELRNQLNELRYTTPTEARITTYMPSSVNRLDYEAQLEVVVPQQMFAQSWRITKWLGNFYPWRRANDQCQLRRRAILTAPTLPFLAVAAAIMWAVNAVFTLGLLLLGIRPKEIDLRPFRDPLRVSPFIQGEETNPPLWWFKKVKNPNKYSDDPFVYEGRSAIFAVLNPPVAVVLFVLWLVIPGLLMWALILAGLVLAVIIITLLAGAGISEWWEASKEKGRKADEAYAKAELARELELLACSTASKEARIDALPKGRRTVRLRFQQAKAEVCKPFAG